MARRRKTNLHLPPRMYLKSGSYYCVTPSNKWIRLSRDLGEAKRKWAELDEEPASNTLGSVITRYMAEVAPKKSPKTYKENIAQSKKLLAVFGKMNPTLIKPHHIAKYLDIRGQAAPISANREKALLSHIFSLAMRWGIVETNPCRGIARNPERPRDRYIEDWEFEAVKSIAGELIAVTMDLAYLTGQRKGDLLKLRLDQLRDEGIVIRQGKAPSSKILIEWSSALRTAVNHAKALDRPVRGLYLLCNRSGQPYTDTGFNAMWQRVMNKALATGIIRERFHFHDIRAKAITDIETAGGDAQSLSGHKTRVMIESTYKRLHHQRAKPVK